MVSGLLMALAFFFAGVVAERIRRRRPMQRRLRELRRATQAARLA